VNQPAPTRSARATPGRADRYAERKRDLARAALATLAEQGFARTSLRDIARASGFSLGVLHYYFTDKVELIGFCVGLYKQDFIEQVRAAVDGADSADGLRRGLSDVLIRSVQEQPKAHRLWYDIRAQSLFDDNFRPAMWAIDREIEAVIGHFLARLAELTGARPGVEAGTAYAVLDGLFQRHLLRHLAGDTGTCERFERELGQVVSGLMG